MWSTLPGPIDFVWVNAYDISCSLDEGHLVFACLGDAQALDDLEGYHAMVYSECQSQDYNSWSFSDVMGSRATYGVV